GDRGERERDDGAGDALHDPEVEVGGERQAHVGDPHDHQAPEPERVGIQPRLARGNHGLLSVYPRHRFLPWLERGNRALEPNQNAIASSVSRDVTGHRYITDEPRGSRAGGCSSAWRAAASTGARARQTETPRPRARAVTGLPGGLRPAPLAQRPAGRA